MGDATRPQELWAELWTVMTAGQASFGRAIAGARRQQQQQEQNSERLGHKGDPSRGAWELGTHSNLHPARIY